jgi:hypothetical protein
VKNDANPSFHGTQVLSKAVNKPYGVGRGIDVTIVRVPTAIQSIDESNESPPFQPQFRWPCFEHGLQMIYNDISGKMTQNSNASFRSVIVSSGGLVVPRRSEGSIDPSIWRTPENQEHFAWDTWYWLQKLTELGVVITTAAGNEADTTDPASKVLRTVPGIWASNDLPIIVSDTN